MPRLSSAQVPRLSSLRQAYFDFDYFGYAYFDFDYFDFDYFGYAYFGYAQHKQHRQYRRHEYLGSAIAEPRRGTGGIFSD
jgi:hypothetical protein